MKVLFISGAKSTHTEKWVNALVDRGIELHLVYNKGDISDKLFFNKEVVQHELPTPFSIFPIKNAIYLRKLYKKIRPDVVNVHDASGYGFLLYLSMIRPYIINVWGTDVYAFPDKSPIHKAILVKNLLSSSLILSTSHAMKQKVLQLLPTKSTIPINVIPFGVNTEVFKKKEISKQEKIIIGNIKSYKPLYGVEYLVRAIDYIRLYLIDTHQQNIFDKLEVRVYGSGTETEIGEVQGLIDSLNLSDTILLNKQIPNSQVPEMLNQFDIFCATSSRESFGVALVEAMSTELPVVATDAEGFLEVVDNNQTGIIVERKNPEAIAKGLLELILDKEKRIIFGINGRKKVLEKYNLSDNVDEMIMMYTKVSNDI